MRPLVARPDRSGKAARGVDAAATRVTSPVSPASSVAPYRLALAELDVVRQRCLFVAGSAYDLIGASRVGLDIWWHDRIGMEKPAEAPEPFRHTRDLSGLSGLVVDA